jgi:hypothetical protein
MRRTALARRGWRWQQVLAVVIAVAFVGFAAPQSAAAIGAAVGRGGSSGGASGGGADPHYCDGCTPPLNYSGGPVLSTGPPTGLTITPVYWVPSGLSYQFPADYEPIVDGYITNVAAASGSASDVFSVATQYYQAVGGTNAALSTDFKAGTPVVDADTFPPSACTPASGYTACLKDSQLQGELGHVLSAHGLTTGLNQFYAVFLPPKVETQDRDGTNSISGFCGYHRSFGSGASVVIYADMPFESSGCGVGQEPNGSYAADGAVSSLSHELTEAMSDPTQNVGWDDSSGHEVGDICADAYGAPLGSTSATHPDTTEYNQVINGAKYYTQEEFSDLAYASQGFGSGCQQTSSAGGLASSSSGGSPSSTSGKTQSAAAPGVPAAVFSDAAPFILPADGKTTTDDRVVVTDENGDAVPGDPVTYSVYNEGGAGSCGTLHSARVKTDSGGVADVNYTTSTHNAVCVIVATEARGGHSSQSLIYQGSTESAAPTATATFPTSLQVGGAAATFQVTVANPSDQPINASRVDLVLFPYNARSPNVDASQVHISSSTDGPNGMFTPIPLTGSTAQGGIDGYVAPQTGETLAPHQTKTVFFTVALSPGTPVPHGKLLILEGYLDQVNAATGSGTTLADTYGTDVTATQSTP